MSTQLKLPFFLSFILPVINLGADHPEFKKVSKLTVNHMKVKNEFNEAYKKVER